MSTELSTALIAGLVSLLVCLTTIAADRWRQRAESARQERELQRKLTEKLYELRIAHYPKAFALTRGLLGAQVFREDLDPAEVAGIRESLSQWNASDASFILSKDALEAYYRLRDALSVTPAEGSRYDEAQRNAMWKAKNIFRGRLRHDLRLLFSEDLRTEPRPRWDWDRYKECVGGLPLAPLPPSIGVEPTRAQSQAQPAAQPPCRSPGR